MINMVWGRMKSFWKEEEGLGTLELLLIIVVILIIALLFKKEIMALITKLIASMNSKSEEFTK
ncbi:Flp1 family type IVb pilin [Paenibacillus pini]